MSLAIKARGEGEEVGVVKIVATMRSPAIIGMATAVGRDKRRAALGRISGFTVEFAVPVEIGLRGKIKTLKEVICTRS